MTSHWITEPHSCDVLVVGAGPAGISAAEQLALQGARVTLLERHVEPGKKVCGGGLTRSSWELLGIDPKQPAYAAETWQKMEVRSPLGKVVVSGVGPQMMTFERELWTAERLEHLQAIGVRLVLGERFLRLDPSSRNGAITSQGKRIFGFLVGADGANSRVRKQIGLLRGCSVRGWQILLRGRDSFGRCLQGNRPVVFFNPALFKSGYGWAFPYRNTLRVGCGASSGVMGAGGLKSSFNKWLSKMRIVPTEGSIRAGSIGCDYQGHRFGNLFLAGDAAGLASPLTGEGIYQALISGREVAREILDDGYRSAIIARLAFRHRRTHDILANSVLSFVLYNISPFLLRFDPVQAATWERYVF